MKRKNWFLCVYVCVFCHPIFIPLHSIRLGLRYAPTSQPTNRKTFDDMKHTAAAANNISTHSQTYIVIRVASSTKSEVVIVHLIFILMCMCGLTLRIAPISTFRYFSEQQTHLYLIYKFYWLNFISNSNNITHSIKHAHIHTNIVINARLKVHLVITYHFDEFSSMKALQIGGPNRDMLCVLLHLDWRNLGC